MEDFSSRLRGHLWLDGVLEGFARHADATVEFLQMDKIVLDGVEKGNRGGAAGKIKGERERGFGKEEEGITEGI